jgi:spore coat polysaccharide biosynthesis protein SpsF
MMMRLGEFYVVEWVLQRVISSKETDVTVLAIPETAENDVLEKLARKYGCEVFRGSEDDVLERLTLSVQQYHPDTVVRVCADRPFVDPDVLDDTVRLFKSRSVTNEPLDLAFSHKAGNGESWPYGFGVEVFSYPRMKWLHRTVTCKYEREHVTLHMWNNAQKFKIEALRCPSVYSKLGPDYKLDLDTPNDFERLKQLVVKANEITLPGYVFVDRASKL